MSVAEAICASIALPDELPPVRVSDSYTTNPVALAKVNQDIKINWQGPATGTVAESEELAFVFRDALRWCVYYDKNSAGLQYRYNWVQFPGLSAWVVPAFTEVKIPVCAGIKDITSAWNPHGDIYFAGDADGDGYLWIDNDCRLVVTDSGTVDNGYANLWHYTQGQRILVQQLGLPGNGSVTFTIPFSGYFGISVVFPTAAAAHTISVYHADITGNEVWRQIAVPDAANNLARVQSMCVSAVSALWRNTASYDNAQGDVGAVIVGPGYEWWSILAPPATPSYSGLAALFPNGWKSFFAAKGIYTFLKPSDEEDLEFKTDIKTYPAGQWSFARFNLRSNATFAALVMSVSLDAGRDTTLRLAAHIQYETNDCWADTRVPEANVDDWLSAVKMLSNVPNITENPLHIKSVLNSIGKVGLILNNVQTQLAPLAAGVASLIPGGSVLAKIGQASLPYQRKGWQYLADYGKYDDGPRTNVDPRQM